jgi:hypothetical protein
LYKSSGFFFYELGVVEVGTQDLFFFIPVRIEITRLQ